MNEQTQTEPLEGLLADIGIWTVYAVLGIVTVAWITFLVSVFMEIV